MRRRRSSPSLCGHQLRRPPSPPRPSPMPELAAAEEAEENGDPLSMDGASLLDFHGGAAASWDFDSASFFASYPPSPPLLSPSLSPPHSFFAYSLPPPPSPLRIMGDRSTEISGKFDSQKEDRDTQYEKIMFFPFSTMDAISDSSYVIKERMTQALRYFKELTNQHVLVQVWAPIKNGDQYVLTTSEQPFVLDTCSNGLLQYRTVSMMYLFSVDESSGGALGLPGRVFNKKLPEWTPNVQYYSCTEYPRLNHALLHNVRGSLALPVFEPSQNSCVGVVELIMTSQKVNYAPEIDKLCRALEAVNLKSSEILEHQSIQICNEGRQAALAEILEILTVVCEAQKLPLAQTWIPCQHGSVLAHHGGSRKSCSSFDGNCMGQVCMSTTHAAFYVVEAHMWGFRDACSEHHLQKGQGVAGRAFAAQSPCFCSDITQFCKREYPLVHYARMFGLGSCLAVCLQSSHSRDDIYVVEFFLPLGCHDVIKQHALLESISTLMKQNFRSLKVITSGKLQESLPFEMIDMISYENYERKDTQYWFPETVTLEGAGEYENKCNADYNLEEQHLMACIYSEKNLATFPDNVSMPTLTNGDKKVQERKRGKAEKIISLEVLQKYFSGSLKDAAKSLGVCPTTMKRICRHHGISRWPCRKINKVNRSLSKLKRVIESVQGADLALNLNSLACPLPVAAGSMSLPVFLDGFAQNQGSVARNEDPSPIKTLETDDPYHKLTAKEPMDGYSASSSKTRSFSEGTMKTTASQGSCHENSGNEVSGGKQHYSPNSEQLDSMDNFLEDQNMVPRLSFADIIVAEAERTDAGLHIEDLASPKEARPAPKAAIIKACYKEDIIRFRLANGISIVALNEEVAKRLRLEVGTFDIKYLDDDHEWVNLACDADLEECMEISTMSGAEVIRLSVHGIPTHLNNSCESSRK